jgi:hypothetical protein
VSIFLTDVFEEFFPELFIISGFFLIIVIKLVLRDADFLGFTFGCTASFFNDVFTSKISNQTTDYPWNGFG